MKTDVHSFDRNIDASFFCVVRVMSDTNSLTQPQANAALIKAIHNVANVKLRAALNAAKSVATASAANKNEKIRKLEAAVAAAQSAAATATAAAPTIPVEPATNAAEASLVNAIIRNISNYSTRENLNKVQNDPRYKNASVNNKARINGAVNKRRFELLTPIVN